MDSRDYDIYKCEDPISNTIIIYVKLKNEDPGISRRHLLCDFIERPDFYIEETIRELDYLVKYKINDGRQLSVDDFLGGPEYDI